MKNTVQERIDLYVESAAKSAAEALTWLVADLIITHFKDYAAYEKSLNGFKAGGKSGNRALRTFENLLNIPKEALALVLNGSQVAFGGERVNLNAKILDLALGKAPWIKRIGKKDVKYASGREFRHLSFFLLDRMFAKRAFKVSKANGKTDLKALLGREPTKAGKAIAGGICFAIAKIRLMKPETLKARADDIISQQEQAMTKAEIAKLKSECDAGMRAFPFEVLKKDIEKKERRKLAALKKRIRKLILQQNAELAAELAKKDAEIKRLKEINEGLRLAKANDFKTDREEKLEEEVRELKSKLEAKAVKKMTYAELLEKYPAGVPDETLESGRFWDSLSDECKARLSGEGEADMRLGDSEYFLGAGKYCLGLADDIAAAI